MTDRLYANRALGDAVCNAIDVSKMMRATVRAVLDHMSLTPAPETGEVTMSLSDIAQQIGTEPDHVLHATELLEASGALRREVTDAGETWFINPRLAWRGSAEARERCAALMPALSVQGDASHP